MPRPEPVDLDDDRPVPRSARRFNLVVGSAVILFLWGCCTVPVAWYVLVRKPNPGVPPAADNARVGAPRAEPPRTEPAKQAKLNPVKARSRVGVEPSVIDGLRLDIIDAGPWMEREGPVFRFVWLASTKDDTRSYRLAGWGSQDARIGDQFRNRYSFQFVNFPVARVGIGEKGSAKLRELRSQGVVGDPAGLQEGPGQVTSRAYRFGDVHFDMPVPAVDELLLDLDGDVAGVTGTFRFIVGRSEWQPAPRSPTRPSAPK